MLIAKDIYIAEETKRLEQNLIEKDKMENEGDNSHDKLII